MRQDTRFGRQGRQTYVRIVANRCLSTYRFPCAHYVRARWTQPYAVVQGKKLETLSINSHKCPQTSVVGPSRSDVVAARRVAVFTEEIDLPDVTLRESAAAWNTRQKKRRLMSRQLTTD